MTKCVERGECETASILSHQGLNQFTQLLFPIEGKYVPYEKWRFHEMTRPHVVGESSLPEIRKILCTSSLEKEELTEKVQILESIIQSTEEQLPKLGISNEWLGEEWCRYEPDCDA